MGRQYGNRLLSSSGTSSFISATTLIADIENGLNRHLQVAFGRRAGMELVDFRQTPWHAPHVPVGLVSNPCRTAVHPAPRARVTGTSRIRTA
jgi:hypothetical protein